LKNLKFGRETDNMKVIEKSSGSKKGEQTRDKAGEREE